jgi:hypothetical protein
MLRYLIRSICIARVSGVIATARLWGGWHKAELSRFVAKILFYGSENLSKSTRLLGWSLSRGEKALVISPLDLETDHQDPG